MRRGPFLPYKADAMWSITITRQIILTRDAAAQITLTRRQRRPPTSRSEAPSVAVLARFDAARRDGQETLPHRSAKFRPRVHQTSAPVAPSGLRSPGAPYLDGAAQMGAEPGAGNGPPFYNRFLQQIARSTAETGGPKSLVLQRFAFPRSRTGRSGGLGVAGSNPVCPTNQRGLRSDARPFRFRSSRWNIR
jgi:hypothetical protein